MVTAEGDFNGIDRDAILFPGTFSGNSNRLYDVHAIFVNDQPAVPAANPPRGEARQYLPMRPAEGDRSGRLGVTRLAMLFQKRVHHEDCAAKRNGMKPSALDLRGLIVRFVWPRGQVRQADVEW
jgi:hypothetical protein